MIHAVPKPISAFGYAGGDSIEEGQGYYKGNIYAYVVLELK